jgi:hypothetical protein
MSGFLQKALNSVGIHPEKIKEAIEDFKDGDKSFVGLVGAFVEQGVKANPMVMTYHAQAQVAATALGKERKVMGETADGQTIYMYRGDDRLNAGDNRVAVDFNNDGEISNDEFLDTELHKKDGDIDGDGKDDTYLSAVYNGHTIIIDRSGGKWSIPGQAEDNSGVA